MVQACVIWCRCAQVWCICCISGTSGARIVYTSVYDMVCKVQ